MIYNFFGTSKGSFEVDSSLFTLKDPMFKNFRFIVTARGVARSPQWDLMPVNQISNNCGTPNARMGLCNQWLTVEQALKSKLANYTDSFLASFSAVCFLTVRSLSLSYDLIQYERVFAPWIYIVTKSSYFLKLLF